MIISCNTKHFLLKRIPYRQICVRLLQDLCAIPYSTHDRTLTARQILRIMLKDGGSVHAFTASAEMISLSYKNFVAMLKALPLCPRPRAVGLENIPLREPVLYVYNHVTRGAEPLFLGLAAPSASPIRFLAEITVLGDFLIERTRRDIVNAVFPPAFQAKARRLLVPRFLFDKFVDILTAYFITQMGRFNIIPVHIHEPLNKEDRRAKRMINRQALEECILSLEKNIPVAIAPSGGSTHEAADDSVTRTVVATLASFLYRRGKVIKIVPCVVKEKPPVSKKTYGHYVADRVFLLRFLKWFMSKLKGKHYERPLVTVEFLAPLTFAVAHPTKSEKLEFVNRMQRQIYDALARD